MTNEEVMEQINYLKSIIEDEIRVSGNKELEKKYNKILNKTKEEEEPDWEEYQRDSQADAEEPEDYRCYEYEPWR